MSSEHIDRNQAQRRPSTRPRLGRRARSAGLAVAAAVALLCSGCLILPKTRTTRRTLGTSVARVERGPVGAPALSMRVRGNRVGVMAVRPRQCVEHLVTEVEVTKKTEATMEVANPGNSQGGVIAFLLVGPITGLVSGLATSIVLATSDDSTTVTRVPVGSRRTDCRVPAAELRVHLTLPSGATLEGVTNAAGTVAFTVPDTESLRGALVVRTDATRPKTFLHDAERGRMTLEETHAFLQPVRSQLRACGRAAGLQGRVPLTIAVEDGRAYLVAGQDIDAGFAACVDATLQEAAFRSASRVELSYAVDFGHRGPSRAQLARSAMVPEDLRKLRKDCAVPIAQYRAGRAAEIPAPCQLLLAP